ncbi:gamma-secretase subunit Aph-1 [Syncephalis fuscata]|nr:gamma-secretase subunit Aph-1 [Syncephalis fuscata]
MTLLSFFGCALTAYGPVVSVFLLTIARDAQLVILAMTSAFFWLVALLLTSVLWYIIPPARSLHPVTLLYAVLIQEIIRWGYFKMIERAEKGLHTTAKQPTSRLNRTSFAFASGLGFGVIYALITYIALLSKSSGPGVLMSPSCPSVSSFFLSAIMTAIMSLTHIFWMMVAFDGFFQPMSVGV